MQIALQIEFLVVELQSQVNVLLNLHSYHQDFSPKEIAERFQAAVRQHSRFLTSPPALVIDNLLRFATFQPFSSHVWLEAACTGQRSSRQFFSQSER